MFKLAPSTVCRSEPELIPIQLELDMRLIEHGAHWWGHQGRLTGGGSGGQNDWRR